MTHIMVDLETLSTSPNAYIIAIGAVKFAPGRGVYSKFYQAITAPNDVPPDTAGTAFHISSNTLNWWAEQSEEARAVFTDPNATSMYVALERFAQWALDGGDAKSIRIWGNGASFDNVILASAYDTVGLPRPWMFYNDRCYRTVKNLYPNTPFERIGTFHNAVDDAESQAKHLLAMEVKLG